MNPNPIRRTLDPSFGNAGKIVGLFGSIIGSARGVMQQADGKLVTGGWTYTGGGSSADFVTLRYSADGVLDAGFGTNGTVITPVAPGTKSDSAFAVALQGDDRVPTTRLLLAGAANDANNNFALTRYWP